MASPKFKNFAELSAIVVLSCLIGLGSFLYFIFQIICNGPRKMLHLKERNVRPALLSDNRFGSHEFIMLKNSRMKLHYVANGPKDKPLMLCLHGFPEFWYSWRYQLKEFSKDYRVVAVDMRGYGESDKPRDISSYYIDHLTSDVRDVIEALGYKKCVLVAHDWGGAVAWMFTFQYPEMVDRLVMCNCPHPGAFMEHLKSSFSQLMMSWYMFFFQVPVLPVVIMQSNDLARIGAAFCGRRMGAKPGAFTEEDVEAYKYSMATYDDMLGPINYYRAMMRYEIADTRSTKIKPKVLMVWGTKDGALSKEMAELSGKYVEDYTLKWVEGASHWVQQEEPQLLNKFMWEFLKN